MDQRDMRANKVGIKFCIPNNWKYLLKKTKTIPFFAIFFRKNVLVDYTNIRIIKYQSIRSFNYIASL